MHVVVSKAKASAIAYSIAEATKANGLKPYEYFLQNVAIRKRHLKTDTVIEKHKVYPSTILDLYDRRIVSYVIRDHYNNINKNRKPFPIQSSPFIHSEQTT